MLPSNTMQPNQDWTTQEVHNFLEWDFQRKNGMLGEPVVFNNADELMIWLHREHK